MALINYDQEGFELDEHGDPILPELFDFAVYYVRDLNRLRKIVTTDELKEAVVDLMMSSNITEEQLNAALCVIRDRLREIGRWAGLFG